MREVHGDLIGLAEEGNFDMIAHGCNCFCTMRRGIAPQIAAAFPDAERADKKTHKGDFDKLGSYSQGLWRDKDMTFTLIVFNIYSQYEYDAKKKPLDYEALTLGLRKINKRWGNMSTTLPNQKGKKRIGLPQIGAGLAGGDWDRIKGIIERELKDMDVTIVYYNKG